jgi:hypothetical protein
VVVLVAFAAIPSAAARENGAPGTALALDGKSAVRIEFGDSLKKLRGFTAECWVRGPKPSKAMSLFGNVEGAGFGVMWSDKGKPFAHGLLNLVQKGYVKPIATRPWAYGAWTHVALSYDGITARFFVGGEEVGAVKHTALINHSTKPFFIGADPDSKGNPTRRFRGLVDEFRFSKVPRYPKRFKPKRRLKADSKTLVLLRFDERTPDGKYPDATDHARHGTPHGAPALVTLDTPIPGAPSGTPLISEHDEALQQRIDPAVARGVKWLFSAQRKDGSWGITRHKDRVNGATALALYALLSSGSTRFDDRVKQGFAFLQERWNDEKESEKADEVWRTYRVACALMALEALGATSPKSVRGTSSANAAGLLPAETQWARELHARLLRHAYGGRGLTSAKGPIQWAYPGGNVDNSCTQMAVLGLRAAERMGIPSQARVWRGILRHYLECQERDGPKERRLLLDAEASGRNAFAVVFAGTSIDRARGWGYKPEWTATPRGSMTATALASMAIAREQLIELANAGDLDARKALDKMTDDYLRAVHDGFAWLAHHYSATGNTLDHGWHYYYLYGLERAGVLCDRVNIGDNDWYRDGAEVFLTEQSSKGSWATGYKANGVDGTAFALLFLTRATPPVKAALTPSHGGGQAPKQGK